MATPARDVERAAAAIRERIGTRRPRVALILGSGLGELVDEMEDPARLPYTGIPDFPDVSVLGHAGCVVGGRLGGREVIAFAGRVHMYEGWSAADAGFPVRVAHAVGARTLFVSNAAGGIDRTLRRGDLMAIADHLNLMWRNPLIGPLTEGEPRFPDMSDPYDPDLRAQLHAAAKRTGVRLGDGVYGGLLGPTYETPAEVRMLERLGVHAVGMSTIPEVIVARALGMRVAGISFISNACGAGSVSHAEVLEITARAGRPFRALVKAWLETLDD